MTIGTATGPARILALALIAGAPAPAAAFEPAEARLLVAWPELSVEFVPGGEAEIYAIVENLPANPGVLYVITWNYKGISRPLGSFRCSRAFEILEQSSNGFRDILCDDSGPITGDRVSVLRMGPDGVYRAR